jgi:hypothetical protein
MPFMCMAWLHSTTLLLLLLLLWMSLSLYFGLLKDALQQLAADAGISPASAGGRCTV